MNEELKISGLLVLRVLALSPYLLPSINTFGCVMKISTPDIPAASTNCTFVANLMGIHATAIAAAAAGSTM